MAEETWRTAVEHHLQKVQEAVVDLPRREIGEIARLLLAALDRGARVYIFGNGGSAATASHLACDLAKSTIVAGAARLGIISLADNVALMTAWANDTSYENIFAEQLKNLLRPQDLVIAISASGNSPNVLAGLRVASSVGATTVGLTGFDGGKLRHLVDVCVVAPGENHGQIEDLHLIVGHAITAALRASLKARRAAVEVRG